MPVPVNLRVDDDLASWVTGRQRIFHQAESVGVGIRTEADLLRSLLALELRRTAWTLGELGVIAQAHSGVLPDRVLAGNVGIVALGVMDEVAAAPGVLGDAWGVDEALLIEKLQGLGAAQDHALMCAIAQWWAERRAHTPLGWAKVGVRVSEPPLHGNVVQGGSTNLEYHPDLSDLDLSDPA